jgi:hypothetical protein
MAIPDSASFVLVILVAVGVVAGLGFKLLRGERLGSVECPLVYGDSLSRIRFTVARESLAAGAASRVQVRVRMPMTFTIHQLEPQQALRLAELLESGAARLHTP